MFRFLARWNSYGIFTNYLSERKCIVNLERMNYNKKILITECRLAKEQVCKKEYIYNEKKQRLAGNSSVQ